MKESSYLASGLSLLWLLGCTTKTQAHTWVEQLSVIASNGTFSGLPGYPRGLVDRLPNVDPNAGNVYELPPDGRPTGNAILPSDLMCKSTQKIGMQTPGNPALIASAGDQIALRYQENGHVTQPQLPKGKPEGSGTVFVYGTEKSSNDDTYLGIHRVWNEDGTGGDGRGVLLATRYFDDGQCYQVNASPISSARQAQFPHTPDAQMNRDLWCQTDVQIPAAASGNYTLYWVWEWPTLDSSGKVTTNQSYTSCMDVVLTPGTNSNSKAVNFATGQNLNYAAIADQMSAQFLVNPTAAAQTFISGGPTPSFTGSITSATGASLAQAISTISQPSSAISNSGAAVMGFVTVTVTTGAGATTETVTVTQTINGGTSSPTPIPTPISTVTLVLGAPFQASNFEPAPTQAMEVKPFYTDHAFHRTGRHARGLKVRNCNLRT